MEKNGREACVEEKHREFLCRSSPCPHPIQLLPLGRAYSRMSEPLINLPGWDIPAIKKAGCLWRDLPIALWGEVDPQGGPELG